MPAEEENTASVDVPPRVLIHWLHDLRNPLAAMVANLHHIRDSLGESDPDGPTVVVGECMALCNVLERYVTNLELLAHRRQARDRPAVHLAEIAADVAKRFAAQASLTGHSLAVVGSADPIVSAEGATLRIALENLVANAVEQSAEGEVRLLVEERAGHGFVSVLDRGPPWTTSDAERLFARPDATLPGPRRARVGRGLGLVAASHAATASGARLVLEPDEAGVFRVGVAAPLASTRDG